MGADVSVVMATRNGERFVGEQLASIAGQTEPPTEVIVGDDASTDDTVRVVEEFRCRAPFPVHVIARTEPLGYSENFLDCSARAVGRYIAFCDQDDVWLPSKLARLSPAFADAATMEVVHDATTVDEWLVSRPSRVPHLGVIRRGLFSGRLFAPHGSRSIIRAELLELCPPSNRPLTMYTWPGEYRQEHDEWAYFAANAAGTVRFLSEKLSVFRRHGGAVGVRATVPEGRGAQLRPRGASTVRYLARGAESRAAYLRARAPSAGAFEACFLREAELYARLATQLEARAGRLNAGWKHRAASFVVAAARGEYGSQGRGGLGWIAAVQDLASLRSSGRPDHPAT